MCLTLLKYADFYETLKKKKKKTKQIKFSTAPIL